jgi:hypothetical protein
MPGVIAPVGMQVYITINASQEHLKGINKGSLTEREVDLLLFYNPVQHPQRSTEIENE